MELYIASWQDDKQTGKRVNTSLVVELCDAFKKTRQMFCLPSDAVHIHYVMETKPRKGGRKEGKYEKKKERKKERKKVRRKNGK